ncbi:hypothetical protein [Microbacterium algeriense]|uniref:hypothetical protein n=1 Tax=Microbacterium algeriense TaxID=2615184 RepID=UPI0029A47391|nr:hypothetical protein [Microbacterium algeriense]MDX2400271.1 hypothetical protein [Microbacterium algeriense]
MELTSREIATLILFAAVIGLAFVVSPDRRGLLRLIGDALVALGAWKVWVPIIVYFVYSSAIVALAAGWGIWSSAQLKDTVVAVLFTGLPILFSATKFKDGAAVFKRVIREVLGVAALLVFYLGFAPFPLWVELILQAVLGFLLVMSAVAARKAETAVVGKAANALGVIVGLGVLIYVTIQVLAQPGSIDWAGEAAAFAVSVWLPLAQIPFVYVFSVVAVYETALMRLRLNNKLVAPPLRVRLALVLGLRGSLRYAASFSGLWIPRVAKERSFADARSTMSAFRSAVRTRDHQRRDRRRRLRRLAGAAGVDASGLWLDRREFVETKSALDDLYFMQVGVRRNGQGRYLDDPSLLLTSWSLRGLPDEHGIAIHTDGGADRWYAFRRTIGGFHFGVGGRRDSDERWQYDGPGPPSDFSIEGTGWREITGTGRSAEWSFDDSDPPEN